jgi:hypothetical protein
VAWRYVARVASVEHFTSPAVDAASELIASYGKVKAKANLSLCLTKYHAMKTYWGTGGIGPWVLHLCARWR